MTQPRYLRLWLILAIVAVLIAAAALWIRGKQVGTPSPLPTPVSASPPPTSTAPSALRVGTGAILMWAALGSVLALGIAFLILRYYRRPV